MLSAPGSRRGLRRVRAPGPTTEGFSRWQRVIGNDTLARWLHSERQADDAARRAAMSPPGGPEPLTRDVGDVHVLSEPGRQYFERLVGGSLSHARLHVGDRAARLADQVGAEALTYGREVFLSARPGHPESAEGRALLAHELAHVVQNRAGRPQVFRKDKVEPHYPTVDEQQEVARALGRDFGGAVPARPHRPPAAAAAGPARAVPEAQQPTAVAGSLSAAERLALAQRLKAPYFEALDALDPGPAAPVVAPLGEAQGERALDRAVKAIQAYFAGYLTHSITLTRDARETAEQRRAGNRVLQTFQLPPRLDWSTMRSVILTHSQECRQELAGLDDESMDAVRDALADFAVAERGEQVQRIVRVNVGGSYNDVHQRVYLNLHQSEAAAFGTAVHELIHHFAHPAFSAAFGRDSDVVEGFTEFFTREVVADSRSASYPKPYAAVNAALNAIRGPYVFGSASREAEESLRLAYFRGQLNLIGWLPQSAATPQAVERAGGSAPWDPDVARRREAGYVARNRAEQDPHSNVLGVGLFFPRGSGNESTIAVRYARVLARTEPYAKWQGLLEGQFVGGPIRDPGSVGASLGIAGEYQEPYFYLGVGLRLVGEVAGVDGDRRLNLTPFGYAGIRAWQRIRVGGEGVVFLPLTGQKRHTALGAGAVVSVEF